MARGFSAWRKASIWGTRPTVFLGGWGVGARVCVHGNHHQYEAMMMIGWRDNIYTYIYTLYMY